MLTEQNDINLSIYDKTTNELKNTLYCITTMINDIKFENKLYNKTNDLVKMIKHLQDNSKDLSTNDLKQLLKPVEDYTQQLSKELVLKEKEYDDKKEKDALQSMSNTLTIVLTTLHKLIHSSEFQDEKEKRGDKDARIMLKNANDGIIKNYSSMGYKNKQLADVINKNIKEGENLLSILFNNVEGDDDTANGYIYYFINKNKKEGHYKITLDVKKGVGIISDENRIILKFAINKIFTFNGEYDFTDEQIKEIDKKLKYSILWMKDRVDLLVLNDKMHR